SPKGARRTRGGSAKARAWVLKPVAFRRHPRRVCAISGSASRFADAYREFRYHARPVAEPILDECFRDIKENPPDLSDTALARMRTLMCDAVPDCLVTEYEHLVNGLDRPDPNDRHVLATAIRAKCAGTRHVQS